MPLWNVKTVTLLDRAHLYIWGKLFRLCWIEIQKINFLFWCCMPIAHSRRKFLEENVKISKHLVCQVIFSSCFPLNNNRLEVDRQQFFGINLVIKKNFWFQQIHHHKYISNFYHILMYNVHIVFIYP